MDYSTEKILNKARKWKESIANLLFKKNVCGICLKVEGELTDWDKVCFIEVGDVHRTLRNIIESTFVVNIVDLLPTSGLCEECVTVILTTFFMVKKIRTNHSILQKYFNLINEQIDLSDSTKLPTEKQLMLTVDNIESLNVPTMVTEKDKKLENVTQIFLCELDSLDLETEVYNTVQYVAKYECPYCGKNYNEYESFKEHYKQHNEKHFRCYRCGKRFKKFDDFIEHRKDTHSDKLSTCDLCKIILLHPTSTEHFDDHSSLYACHICEINFSEKHALEDHVSDNHAVVICQCCYKSFNSRWNLEHHRCHFKCQECKDMCIHEDYLASYRKQHMSNQTEFKCLDCDFKYSTRSQLICHVNEEHLHHFPYLCDLCGESFASKPHLTNHNYKKHADEPHIFGDKVTGSVARILIERSLECHSCGLFFDTEQAFLNHCKKHINGGTKCPFCGKSFVVTSELSAHIKQKRCKEVNEKIEIYQCSMCPLDFSSEEIFFKHIATHPDGTKHVCRECNNSFSHANLFHSHMKKHTIKYDKQCPICFKKYTKFTLRRHMKIHEDGQRKDVKVSEKITCEVCRVDFNSEKALIKHAMTHKELKQCPTCLEDVNCVFFSKHIKTHVQAKKPMKECPYCKYTTKFSTCFEAHINRYHLKRRPYSCEVCSKKFFSEYTLRSHRTTHEDVRPEHYCHICGRKFISKKAVILHTRLHTGETPYPCEFCDLSFISASRRRQHMIRKHFEPSIECNICNKKLYTKSDLRRHIGDLHDGESKRKKAKKGEVTLEFDHEPEIEQVVIGTTQ